jgi:SAM-dependent methyltransferase
VGDPTADADLIGARWDDEYRDGRYGDEAPLPFVAEILATLRSHGEVWPGVGLYVGCGNGRNFLPLIDAGARLRGLDVSEEAIRQLRSRRPEQSLSLEIGDFRSSDLAEFDYLIAIQVFQHGDDDDAARYFARAAAAVRPGGLFFLRVNSAATEVYHRHTRLGENRHGGFTVRYDEGPKQGLPVHFYSRDELLARTAADFRPLRALREEVIQRVPPKTGSWAQWEGIWQRTIRAASPGTTSTRRRSPRGRP